MWINELELEDDDLKKNETSAFTPLKVLFVWSHIHYRDFDLNWGKGIKCVPNVFTCSKKQTFDGVLLLEVSAVKKQQNKQSWVTVVRLDYKNLSHNFNKSVLDEGKRGHLA